MKINKGYEIRPSLDSLEFHDYSDWHDKDSSENGWTSWFTENSVQTTPSKLILDYVFPVGHSVPTCSR
jgi:hypothetical protein